MKYSTPQSSAEINAVQQKEIEFRVSRHCTDKKIKILRVLKAQG